MEENIVELTRFAYTPMGTFGRLSVGNYRCFTVELPWFNNIPGESCIPEGRYRLILGRYNKGGYAAYEVTGVIDRTRITIQRGNIADDLLGGIALGAALGCSSGKWAVTGSEKAFFGFMEAMGGDEGALFRVGHFIPV